MKKMFSVFFCTCFVLGAVAQDSIAPPKKLTISGYIKNLQSLNADKHFNRFISGNLLHNRINMRWKPSEEITMAADLRNRLFWGEEVRNTPDFVQQLKNPTEKINMGKVWIQKKSLVFHTNTERLYIDYNHDKLNARVGRQRINWGMTTNWNPNDLFNTYNFLDFDYEERPGADGAKIRYVLGNAAAAELAYAFTGNRKGGVAALKYAFNKKGYDIQCIAGLYNKHITLGTGWAGSIKEAGFKGEAQYFFRRNGSTDHLNLALEADYMFKKGWYVNAGFLFNSQGLTGKTGNAERFSFDLSPENPMPAKWNMIMTTAKEITPLLSASIGMLYSPGTNLLIFFPSLRYNLATNLDLNLVWQSFFADTENGFEAMNHLCFLRLKWSY